jgi:hypothetical protein
MELSHLIGANMGTTHKYWHSTQMFKSTQCLRYGSCKKEKLMSVLTGMAVIKGITTIVLQFAFLPET